MIPEYHVISEQWLFTVATLSLSLSLSLPDIIFLFVLSLLITSYSSSVHIQSWVPTARARVFV